MIDGRLAHCTKFNAMCESNARLRVDRDDFFRADTTIFHVIDSVDVTHKRSQLAFVNAAKVAGVRHVEKAGIRPAIRDIAHHLAPRQLVRLRVGKEN